MFRCKYCGYFGIRKYFELDHPIPIARASLAQLLGQQLELICSGCNRQKGVMTPYQYVVWRQRNLFKANFGPIK